MYGWTYIQTDVLTYDTLTKLLIEVCDAHLKSIRLFCPVAMRVFYNSSEKNMENLNTFYRAPKLFNTFCNYVFVIDYCPKIICDIFDMIYKNIPLIKNLPMLLSFLAKLSFSMVGQVLDHAKVSKEEVEDLKENN